MDNVLEEIELSSGKVFFHGNFAYIKTKQTNTHCYFKCKKLNCQATSSYNLHTQNVTMINHHNCQTTPAFCGSLRALSRYDLLAKSGMSASALATTLLEAVSREISEELPTKEALRLRFQRLQSKNFPRLPRTINELRFVERFANTLRGTRFLLVDEQLNNERVSVFASDEDLRSLCQSDTIFCDGTFFSSPQFYTQIYTFHSMSYGKLFPRIYALLTSKTITAYRFLLRSVKDYVTDNLIGSVLTPRAFTCDFEKAMINVIHLEFPLASVYGCYFHYCNSILRYVKMNGLTVQYRDNAIFRTYVRLIMALGFIELQSIQDVYFLIKNTSLFVLPQLHEFWVYFEREWLTKFEVWNVHNREFRTNNHLEGWHNKFNNKVGTRHPNIWRTINAFQMEENGTRNIEGRFQNFLDVSPRRNIKYVRIQRMIGFIMERYVNLRINAIELLRSLANVQLTMNVGDGRNLASIEEMRFAIDQIPFYKALVVTERASEESVSLNESNGPISSAFILDNASIHSIISDHNDVSGESIADVYTYNSANEISGSTMHDNIPCHGYSFVADLLDEPVEVVDVAEMIRRQTRQSAETNLAHTSQHNRISMSTNIEQQTPAASQHNAKQRKWAKFMQRHKVKRVNKR